MRAQNNDSYNFFKKKNHNNDNFFKTKEKKQKQKPNMSTAVKASGEAINCANTAGDSAENAASVGANSVYGTE